MSESGGVPEPPEQEPAASGADDPAAAPVDETVASQVDQPVVAHYFQRSLLARGGQPYPAMTLVFDQWRRGGGKLLQHIGDGCRGHAQRSCQEVAGHLILRRSAQKQNGLEVIVHGFAV